MQGCAAEFAQYMKEQRIPLDTVPTLLSISISPLESEARFLKRTRAEFTARMAAASASHSLRRWSVFAKGPEKLIGEASVASSIKLKKHLAKAL